jgi:glycosyltransferase involved in cell wall biosynthesis
MSEFDAHTPFHSKLYRLASNLGERVVFTGYIKQQELPYVYNLANVAVLPSMWDEPAGLTNIEAIACGTTVITTKSGGIPEYVENNGIVLERDQQLVKEITDSIENLMKNPCSLKQKNESFRKEFGIENYLYRFIHSL